jgi:hypothetical protein
VEKSAGGQAVGEEWERMMDLYYTGQRRRIEQLDTLSIFGPERRSTSRWVEHGGLEKGLFSSISWTSAFSIRIPLASPHFPIEV